MNKRAIKILLWILLPGILMSQMSYAGFSTGGSFSTPGYGAQAWGMGGAMVADGVDESAVYWNPALLSCLQNNSLGLSYVNLVPDAKAHHSFLTYARILKRAEEEDDTKPRARHAAGLMYGNLLLRLHGDLSYSEDMIRFAYAYMPDYFISLGVAANFLISRSGVENFSSTGTAIDVGTRIQLLENLAFGLVVRNAVSRINYEDGLDYTIGRQTTAALSMNPIDKLRIEADAVFAHGGLSRGILGVEYALFPKFLILRGGISNLSSGESRNILHFGMGFTFQRYALHYNANLDSEEALTDTHRFSLSIHL